MAWRWPSRDETAEDFWESVYSHRDQVWNAGPNVALVAEISDVAPGSALDLGCGEGGDAVWLAQRGWTVTAIDISPTAVARGAAAANERGVGDRIRWQSLDLISWQPSEQYDLVHAAYLHSPVELDRSRVLKTASGGVKAGGILLIVGHAAPASWQEPSFEVHLPTSEEVLDALALPSGEWRVERMEEFTREQASPDGTPGTRRDTVLRLKRARQAPARSSGMSPC
jgi:SAM-dependent methyltransferase